MHAWGREHAPCIYAITPIVDMVEVKDDTVVELATFGVEMHHGIWDSACACCLSQLCIVCMHGAPHARRAAHVRKGAFSWPFLVPAVACGTGVWYGMVKLMAILVNLQWTSRALP